MRLRPDRAALLKKRILKPAGEMLITGNARAAAERRGGNRLKCQRESIPASRSNQETGAWGQVPRPRASLRPHPQSRRSEEAALMWGDEPMTVVNRSSVHQTGSTSESSQQRGWDSDPSCTLPLPCPFTAAQHDGPEWIDTLWTAATREPPHSRRRPGRGSDFRGVQKRRI